MPGFDSNITNYAHTGAALQVNNPGGDALSSLAQELGAGFGNIAGNGVNYLFNSALQNQQFQNQQALQRSAFRMNQKAVQQQARLQAIGMQQAGMSPAGVNGSGAPSLQAGAAAGATSGMSNIFSGLAEIIAAAKLPSDLSKTDSEVLLNKANAGKAGEEAEQIQHANADWTSYNDFMKKHGPQIFAKEKEALENAVVREWTDDDGNKHTESLWDFLPEETQSTYQKIIDGDIPMTSGNFKAMSDDVEMQAKLTEAQARKVAAATHAGLLVEKLQDPKALDAMLSEEKNKVRELEQGIKESKSRSYANYQAGKKSGAEAKKISQETPTPQQSKELIAAQVKLMQTEVASKIQAMDQAALKDFAYLVEHGKWNQALLRLGMNATEEAIDVVKSIAPWALAARGVRAGVQALEKGKTPPPGKDSEGGIIRPPFDTKGATFENYNDWRDVRKTFGDSQDVKW